MFEALAVGYLLHWIWFLVECSDFWYWFQIGELSAVHWDSQSEFFKSKFYVLIGTEPNLHYRLFWKLWILAPVQLHFGVTQKSHCNVVSRRLLKTRMLWESLAQIHLESKVFYFIQSLRNLPRFPLQICMCWMKWMCFFSLPRFDFGLFWQNKHL